MLYTKPKLEAQSKLKKKQAIKQITSLKQHAYNRWWCLTRNWNWAAKLDDLRSTHELPGMLKHGLGLCRLPGVEDLIGIEALTELEFLEVVGGPWLNSFQSPNWQALAQMPRLVCLSLRNLVRGHTEVETNGLVRIDRDIVIIVLEFKFGIVKADCLCSLIRQRSQLRQCWRKITEGFPGKAGKFGPDIFFQIFSQSWFLRRENYGGGEVGSNNKDHRREENGLNIYNKFTL